MDYFLKISGFKQCTPSKDNIRDFEPESLEWNTGKDVGNEVIK